MRFSVFQLCSNFHLNSITLLMDQCNNSNSHKDSNNSSSNSNFKCHRGIIIAIILQWLSLVNSSNNKRNYPFYNQNNSNLCSKYRSNNFNNSCLPLNHNNNPSSNSNNKCK